MEDNERHLRILVPEAAGVHVRHLSLSLLLLLLLPSVIARLVPLMLQSSSLAVKPDEEGECCADVKQVVRKVQSTDDKNGGEDEGAGAADLGAGGVVRGGKVGDEEEQFVDKYAVEKQLRLQADFEPCKWVGGAAAGEGQDHPDESEEDFADEREAHRRGEGAEGTTGCDKGEGRIY
ncbi:uncharacterized protein MONOS_11477 [Monocercomonoides exilis]|uniref:uncharacterized protein n=1 Tax=Monocercomonoides exilis TaxID=2049356 RepID=UPI0035598E16|nr:hypothetical protein MONOS_11477 [Monocercomonoides exilis]|eukprot:MONOS_11477.1-p1 / transcript=MONOS_11477.1 / gene=MONOS_11477 / organism=Monocercomonoides_exilis_PA203 / gene_product=unspecified product / transcript_product=unspecified product / location=Mono_scaffold00579:1042-1667(+) / protein_length=177 / sequence_SO=supercontig / SO=protein_coding / is_pseudo=false